MNVRRFLTVLGIVAYGAVLAALTLLALNNQQGTGTVAPQVLLLTGFVTYTWSLYFAFTVADWLDPTPEPTRTRRQELIVRFRRMIVALCALLLPASFYVRTALVLLGVGDAAAGQVVFFALASSNVVGSVFVLASLKLD